MSLKTCTVSQCCDSEAGWYFFSWQTPTWGGEAAWWKTSCSGHFISPSIHPHRAEMMGGRASRWAESHLRAAHTGRGEVCVTEVEAAQREALLRIMNVFCTESFICLAISEKTTNAGSCDRIRQKRTMTQHIWGTYIKHIIAINPNRVFERKCGPHVHHHELVDQPRTGWRCRISASAFICAAEVLSSNTLNPNTHKQSSCPAGSCGGSTAAPVCPVACACVCARVPFFKLIIFFFMPSVHHWRVRIMEPTAASWDPPVGDADNPAVWWEGTGCHDGKHPSFTPLQRQNWFCCCSCCVYCSSHAKTGQHVYYYWHN